MQNTIRRRLQAIKDIFGRFGKVNESGRKLLVYVRKNCGRIIYYGCVMLGLWAIACAAENIRGEEIPESSNLILPAVGIENPLDADDEERFILPDVYELICPYSEAPRWERTLGQWQNHMAADYTSRDGEVKSISSGMVSTVGKSGIYGGFIEIETDEYRICYASVDPLENLEPGCEIEKGQTIGRINDSMVSEAHRGAHVHIEINKAGRLVNPEEELKKIPAGNN